MGAEQSSEQAASHHRPQQLRKTETANFDFRQDGATLQRSFLVEAGGESRTEGRRENTRRKEKTRDNNYYWLEVGMDVVKKID